MCFCLFVPGLPREPKYSHLKYLHKAIKLAESALVATDPAVSKLGNNQEVRVFKVFENMLKAKKKEVL